MRLFKFKLHNQIFIALITGAIFGSIFHVNKSKLEIKYVKNNIVHSSIVENWKFFSFITDETKTFASNNQLLIIQRFKSLTNEEKQKIVINVDGIEFRNIKSIDKIKTIAIVIKPIGDIFIRLLNMIAIPLVLASLIVGAASLGDIKKLARIGTKTISLYLITTTIAILIGLVLANIIQPGKQMSQQARNELLSVYKTDATQKIATEVDTDIVSQIVNLVPKNPFQAMNNAEMLQIVLFAVLFGLALTFIDREKAKPVIGFLDGVGATMIKLVDLVMYIAPFAVFALISAVVGEFGFEILQTLLLYTFTVLLALTVHTIFVYGGILKLFTPMKIKTFFIGMKDAQLVGFSTSSSAATLPVNMECCEKNLGISKSIISFTLPLGATINMDGTAIMQGVATIFIAQVYGMELGIIQQLTIILTATLSSIGTAPVPGVGIVMLIIVLKSVGVPEEGIALILGVDRILDMSRTITNITGDAACSVVVAHTEGELKIA
jgi:Na+/H+-dicarboxylate symporter